MAASCLSLSAIRFICHGVIVFIVWAYFLYSHHVYQPRSGAPVLGTLGLTLIDLFAGLLILLSLDRQPRVSNIHLETTETSGSDELWILCFS